MSFPDKNDQHIKETYLALLVRMSEADGKMITTEEHFILSVGSKIGLQKSTIIDIYKNPQQYIDDLPDSLDERISQFYYILYLMGIDGNISPEEIELCKRIGVRLCPVPDLVDDLIQIMMEHLDKMIPADILIKTVKKYFN